MGGHTEKGIRLQVESNSSNKLIEKSCIVQYFVAWEEGQIVGICGFDKNRVHTLFVDIDFQNRGVGKDLLNNVLIMAAKDGIQSIDTWATFYSVPFYRSFGFEKIREIHLPEGTDEIILIEMRKWLL